MGWDYNGVCRWALVPAKRFRLCLKQHRETSCRCSGSLCFLEQASNSRPPLGKCWLTSKCVIGRVLRRTTDIARSLNVWPIKLVTIDSRRSLRSLRAQGGAKGAQASFLPCPALYGYNQGVAAITENVAEQAVR